MLFCNKKGIIKKLLVVKKIIYYILRCRSNKQKAIPSAHVVERRIPALLLYICIIYLLVFLIPILSIYYMPPLQIVCVDKFYDCVRVYAFYSQAE